MKGGATVKETGKIEVNKISLIVKGNWIMKWKKPNPENMMKKSWCYKDIVDTAGTSHIRYWFFISVIEVEVNIGKVTSLKDMQYSRRCPTNFFVEITAE